MQISIYLDSKLIKKIDRQAKKAKQSRSRLIQSILAKILTGKKRKSAFDEVFGILDSATAKRLIGTIQKSRRDSARFF